MADELETAFLMIKTPLMNRGVLLAGVPGLEPRRTESESAILPLDDTPITERLYSNHFKNSSLFYQKLFLIHFLFN